MNTNPALPSTSASHIEPEEDDVARGDVVANSIANGGEFADEDVAGKPPGTSGSVRDTVEGVEGQGPPPIDDEDDF